MNEALLSTLVCPHDHSALHLRDGGVICEQGHRFAIEYGVPVLTDHPRREPVPLNMPPMPQIVPQLSGEQTQPVDPFVNDWIVNTNGNLYWRARGRLTRYPIPDWRFGAGNGRTLLDIGCGWGRWSIAAARAGFRPTGLDVHIDAVAAAGRVCEQLGADCYFVCGGVDALPFPSQSLDCVFSYSVLQHMDKTTVHGAFREIARVLKPNGLCRIQLPNKIGALSVTQQLRRGFREARSESFEMRYWSRAEIRGRLEAAGLCDVRIRTDGFFSQNPQLCDLDLLGLAGRFIVIASHAGCRAADVLPVLTRVADSFWIEARAT